MSATWSLCCRPKPLLGGIKQSFISRNLQAVRHIQPCLHYRFPIWPSKTGPTRFQSWELRAARAHPWQILTVAVQHRGCIKLLQNDKRQRAILEPVVHTGTCFNYCSHGFFLEAVSSISSGPLLPIRWCVYSCAKVRPAYPGARKPLISTTSSSLKSLNKIFG